jgi:hypothetical protein
VLIKESEWIARQLAEIPDDALFPLLNVGSSTRRFRERVQPQIARNVFDPLRARGGAVIHLDMKGDDGVDVVGDLADAAFRSNLVELGCRSALISNLFEHVADRRSVADAVASLIQPGGYLIVTGPQRFPYHPDPIDTRFRPTPDEMAAYFPGMSVVATASISAGNWRQWDPSERGGTTVRWMLARLVTPFYKPRAWWSVAQFAPYLIRDAVAFGVTLRRDDAPLA